MVSTADLRERDAERAKYAANAAVQFSVKRYSSNTKAISLILAHPFKMGVMANLAAISAMAAMAKVQIVAVVAVVAVENRIFCHDCNDWCGC